MAGVTNGVGRREASGPASGRRDFATFEADAEMMDDEQSKSAKTRTGFDEKSFVKQVTSLCDAGNYEQATHYFLRNADRLLASKVNPKEKFNHFLYLTRLIQAGAGTKHGYQKLLRKAGRVEKMIEGLALPAGGSFIDLGCGAHDPLALATYYYLNGFDTCYGIDLLPKRNARYSGLSMYDILTNVRNFPKRYCREGTEPRSIMQRAGEFAIGQFERGNFDGGFSNLKGTVRFDSTDIALSPIPDASVSLIVSFAVLEHVSDIDGVCQKLLRLLKPGGVVYHFVDLADHRAYRSDGQFGPLSFLADAEAPANMNRLRAPEITEAHRRAGFEIISEARGAVEMPESVRTNLQPRFQSMTIEELSAIKLELVVRRPA